MGISEVGVSAILLVQNDLVHLVVGLEHHFGAEVGDQALELHAHGGRVAAAAAVFGFQDDHGVFAVHDHVAGADFLSDFHRVARTFVAYSDCRPQSAAGHDLHPLNLRSSGGKFSKASYFIAFSPQN